MSKMVQEIEIFKLFHDQDLLLYYEVVGNKSNTTLGFINECPANWATVASKAQFVQKFEIKKLYIRYLMY